jgi:hypothetical protein
MKKVLIFSLMALMGIFVACKSGKQGDTVGGNSNGPYKEKSGTITFKPMNMMDMSIKQIIYFDDYGNKEVHELITQRTIMGKTITSHVMDIRDGLTNTHFELENNVNGQDIAKKEAIRQEIPRSLVEQQDFMRYSEAMKKKMQYTEDGTETVAGIQGTKYSMVPDSANPTMVMKGVHYNNIPLKIIIGAVEIVAEKVDFETKIPAEKFKVPEGYTIIDRKANENVSREPASKDGMK